MQSISFNKVLNPSFSMGSNRCIINVFAVLLGVLLLLVGMWIVGSIVQGVTSSYIDLIVLYVSLSVVGKITGLKKYIGKNSFRWFMFFSVVLALFNLVYSEHLVFARYLAAGSGDISVHPEHALSYFRMSSIADIISRGESYENVDTLNLNQYKWLYTYYSLMFVFGGDVVTHINVFNMYHLGISGILMVLIADKLGIKDRNTLTTILFICLLQPMLHCLFAYHRDIVGQAALSLGMYLFVSTYRNNLANIIVLPIYALLFYSYRLQYLVVAIVLYFWALFRGNKRDFSFFAGILAAAIFLFIIISTINTTTIMTFFAEDLNITDYVEDTERLSFVGNLILGLVGYFPWTTLFKDINWSYHIFAYLQGAMNIIIVFYAIKSSRKHFGKFLNNPALFAGSLFFVIAFFVAGHTTYVSVAIPFLALAISGVSTGKVYRSFILLCILYWGLSWLYNTMGLTGSGMLS